MRYSCIVVTSFFSSDSWSLSREHKQNDNKQSLGSVYCNIHIRDEINNYALLICIFSFKAKFVRQRPSRPRERMCSDICIHEEILASFPLPHMPMWFDTLSPVSLVFSQQIKGLVRTLKTPVAPSWYSSPILRRVLNATRRQQVAGVQNLSVKPCWRQSGKSSNNFY